MPNNKRRHSGSGRPRGRPRQRDQFERSELLAEFELWISSRDAAGPVQIVGSLLDLKADELGSPDPTLWTEELTLSLLTEVVPRKVIQTRLDAMDLVPALGLFFDFLRDRDRFADGSMTPQATAALMAGLEFTVLEAVDDPTRRSFSTNILTYGIEHGVDPEDQEALAAYMEWYNTLSHAHRVELSDTGRIRDPAVSYDPSRALAGPPGEHGSSFFAGPEDHRDFPPSEADAPSWPWFLPETDPDLEQIREWDPHRHLPVYRDSVLVQRAQILLDFVGDGRRVTSTGALNRADTAVILERFGIDRTARSMWDVAEIEHVWTTLHDGSWLIGSPARVRPGTGPVAPVSADEDPERFVDFGHALLMSTLGSMWARDGADGGFTGMPDTLTALLYVCRDEGLGLYDLTREEPPEIPKDPRTGGPDMEETLRYLHVTGDLAKLRAAGVLDGDESHVHGSPAVLIAAIGMTEIIDQMGETP